MNIKINFYQYLAVKHPEYNLLLSAYGKRQGYGIYQDYSKKMILFIFIAACIL